MASDLVIRVIADTQKSIKELAQVQQEINKTAKQIKNLQLISMGLKAVGSAFNAISSAIQGQVSNVYSWIKAYEEGFNVNIRLASTIKSLGLNLKDTLENLDDFTNSLKLTTNYSKDSLLATVQVFLAIGKSTQEAKNLTKLTADIASFLGKDIEEIAFSLAKALMNPQTAYKTLTSAGIILQENQTKLLRSLADTGDMAKYQATLIQILKDNYDGLAERLAVPSKIMENTWEDMQQALGQFATVIYASLIKMVAPALDNVGNSLTQNKEALDGLISVFANLMSIAQRFFDLFISGLQSLLQTVRSLLGVWDSIKRIFGKEDTETSKQIANIISLDAALERVKVQARSIDWAEEFRKNAEEFKKHFLDLEDIPEGIGKNFSNSFNEATNQVIEDLDSIKKELEEVGMSDIEKRLNELKQKGATEEQLKEAQEMLEKIEAIKKAREEENEKLREAQRIRESLKTEEEKTLDEIEKAKNLFKEGYLNANEYIEFLRKQKATIEPKQEEGARYASAVALGSGAFSAIISAMEAYRKSKESPEAQTAKNTRRIADLLDRLIKEQSQELEIEL